MKIWHLFEGGEIRLSLHLRRYTLLRSIENSFTFHGKVEHYIEICYVKYFRLKFHETNFRMWQVVK